MKWDNLKVSDLLVNQSRQAQELQTETRLNAGATASFDYINDKKDQRSAETMKWVTTVGELATSKLSWSVWDWNDPKSKDKRPDVCIGSAEGTLMLKLIREGGTELSETIMLENQSFDNKNKKKAAGKVTIVLNAKVMKSPTATATATSNPKDNSDRTVTADDQVEVSITRIDANELPHVKEGGLGILNKNDVYMKLKLGPKGKDLVPPSRLLLSVWDHNSMHAHTKIGSVEVDVASMLKDIRAGNTPSKTPSA